MTKLRIIRSILLFVVAACGFLETAEVTHVSEGVTHRVVRREKPLAVAHVVQVDLTVGYRVVTTKAGSRIHGLERVSAMASKTANKKALVAINGDFFGADGKPTGPQVVSGKIVKAGSKRWPSFGMVEDVPFVSTVRFEGHLLVDGASFEIDNVNAFRLDNEIVFYNSYFGSNTQTNDYGVEIRVDSLFHEARWVGDTISGVVSGIESGTGNSRVSPDGCVVSAHGKMSQALLELIEKGDTVGFCFQFVPVEDRLRELIGGFPEIVTNGKVNPDFRSVAGPAFTEERHPRSAVGIDQTGKKLFLVAVDGRQAGYSEGMTLEEVANLMIEYGVWQGINLDGGGSTTLVINGKVVNQPSDDSGERLVSNAILVLEN